MKHSRDLSAFGFTPRPRGSSPERRARTNDDGVTNSHGQVSVCADHAANAAGPSCSSVALMTLPLVPPMRGISECTS